MTTLACRLTLVLGVLIMGLGRDAHAEDVYVSPWGDDNNPGTQLKPVATLEAARNTLRRHKESGRLGSAGATVWIEPGAYELKRSLVLLERDSGTPEAPIVWRAKVKGQVSVTGGRRISEASLVRVTEDRILRRLTEEAGRHVVQVDLGALGLGFREMGRLLPYGHARPVHPAPLELFFDGEPMPLASYPNQGTLRMGKVVNPGSVPRTGDYTERGGSFEYIDPRHAVWAGQKDIWLQGTFNYGFADDFLLIQSIHPESRVVKLIFPHLYGLASGQPYQSYVACNILDELDRPGEWYLDRDTRLLYWWPPAAIQGRPIQVSMLEEPIICLEGASHVTLRDLIVEVGRGIGIYLERGTSNLIAGCTVRNVGTSGIFLGQGATQIFPHHTVDDYTGVPVARLVGSLQNHLYQNTAWDRQAGTHHRVLSCDVYHTGSGGICLGGGSKRELIPGHNTVENCRIHDYNRRNKFCWAGINVDGCGNRVAHCEIFNSDWQGIYVHGNDHVFEFNNIHHVTLNSNDTSPWYLGRDPSDRGNVVRYNYFHHCGNPERMTMGIYCDDSTTGVLVHGNVFDRMLTSHGVLFSNSGWDLVMTNNIVIEPLSHTVMMSAHYYTWAKAQAPAMFGEQGLLRQRLGQSVDIFKPPYSDRYPELKNYLDPIRPGQEWEGMRPRRNLFAGNVIVGGPRELVSLVGGEHAQFESRNNLVTTNDPGFVDFKNRNYALRPDAEVYAKIPGFQAIPFERMGVYPDAYRAP